jgi:hypothetical protein
MYRAFAALACACTLAGCAMSMPSMDFFKSGASTETLRIESDPPGADAHTTEGQNCRTPCELVVPSGGETAIAFALNGYQPLTIPVRTEQPGGQGSGFEARLQPNPVYAELQPIGSARPGQKPQPKRRTTASQQPPRQPAAGEPTAYPGGYPWPPPPQ